MQIIQWNIRETINILSTYFALRFFFFSIADTHCVPINCLVKRLLCLSTDKNIIHNLNYVFKIYILYANVYKSDYIGAQMWNFSSATALKYYKWYYYSIFLDSDENLYIFEVFTKYIRCLFSIKNNICLVGESSRPVQGSRPSFSRKRKQQQNFSKLIKK